MKSCSQQQPAAIVAAAVGEFLLLKLLFKFGVVHM